MKNSVTMCCNKNSPTFLKVAQKVAIKSVFLKRHVCQNMPKSSEIFWLLLLENLLPRSFKNSPIWSHRNEAVGQAVTVKLERGSNAVRREGLFRLTPNVGPPKNQFRRGNSFAGRWRSRVNTNTNINSSNSNNNNKAVCSVLIIEKNWK